MYKKKKIEEREMNIPLNKKKINQLYSEQQYLNRL